MTHSTLQQDTHTHMLACTPFPCSSLSMHIYHGPSPINRRPPALLELAAFPSLICVPAQILTSTLFTSGLSAPAVLLLPRFVL